MYTFISTFFTSIGQGKKGAFLSLVKQIILLLPFMLILANTFGLMGILFATPLSDVLSFIIGAIILYYELKKIPKEDQI